MFVRIHSYTVFIGLVAGALGLVACGSDGGTGTGGGTSSSSTTTSTSTSTSGTGSTSTSGTGGSAPAGVMINFEARVGDKVFSCADTYDGLGTAGTQVKLVDFRFYVSDVRLLLKGGGEVPLALDQDGVWQYQGVALLDFENKIDGCSNGTTERNSMIMGTAPPGAYEGIAFKLGVPEALNHADVATAPSPLNLSGLFWNWQGGYKFLRVDAAPTQPGLATFNMHLGSTACTGDPAMGSMVTCANLNVPEIKLTPFDPEKNTVVFDYAALVAASNLATNGGGPPGCMSGATDPDCGPVFGKLGLDLATGSASGAQAVFSIK